MSRIDNLGEILDGYEGRKYDSGYVLSEEDIQKIYDRVVSSVSQTLNDVPRLFNIACDQGNLEQVIYVHRLDEPNDHAIETAAKNTRETIKDINSEFGGIIFYTAETHPFTFVQSEDLKAKKYIPDETEIPNNFLIINKEKKYILYREDGVHTNIKDLGELK